MPVIWKGKMKRNSFIVCILTILSTFFLNGCIFHQYPAIEKQLHVNEIPKTKVPELKKIIIANGYKRISNDDYSYADGFSTQYEKIIVTTPEIKINSNVHVLFRFKDKHPGSDFYTNFCIYISNLDHNDVQEITSEIQNIESLMYQALIGFTDPSKVVRRNRY